MKFSAKYYAVLFTAVGMSWSAIDASAASLRSPRHGQETVDVNGGPATEPPAPMGMMHHGEGMPMMEHGGSRMEMMQTCREKMGAMDGMPMPGRMGMGHRSNMHEQMRSQMRKCMPGMNSGEPGSGGMMMQR